jgi:glycosyltransferase involved in cell wall biosynthesis
VSFSGDVVWGSGLELRVVVVTGIWPPDVGGPAVHGPELADHLVASGHEVVAVTTADRAPAPRGYEVRWVPRRIPPGVRHLRAVAMITASARDADLVYAAGMVGRSGLAALLARRPIVVRLAADPAYERAVRRGLTRAPVERFQRERGAQIALLRAVRDLALRRATRIVVPSRFLADVAAGWGIERAHIAVLPNPVDPPVLDDRGELRRMHGLDGPTLAFTGRFAPQKALGVALDALSRVEGISLVLAGDGPERPAVEAAARRMGLGSRVRFLGPQPRPTVFELLRAADAALLTSTWENFPFAVVEALAVGTPVLATNVGGVPEIIEEGHNGLLVPPDDPEAMAAAISRFFGDAELRERLGAGAVASAARNTPDVIFGQFETIFEAAAKRG